jgi:Protein of unknown function (DUF726)
MSALPAKRATLSRHRFAEELLADLGGLVLCASASLSPPPAWLSGFLARALGSRGLDLPPTSKESYIAAALVMSSTANSTSRAAEAANRHAESLFGVGLGTQLLHCVLAADIVSGVYDARTREACMRMLSAMRLPPRVLYDVEMALREELADEISGAQEGEEEAGEVVLNDESLQRQSRSRWLKIGGATVLSGVALGLSGGMLAPAILPALSAVGVTAASGAGASTAIVAAFGTAGAGLGGVAMRNRIGAVEEFLFERCVCVGGEDAGGARGQGSVSPQQPRLDVVVKPAGQGVVSEAAGGSLLVYAWETWQAAAMAVPGGIKFGVQLQSGRRSEWVVAEALHEVGGRGSGGRAKRQRYTGAATVLEKPQGDDKYVLKWSLLPGSLAASVSYRAAWIPCGHEMPPWILGNEEKEGGTPAFHRALSSKRVAALSCSLFVPGLLQVAADQADPGVISDQFCGPGGVVESVEKLEVESFALVWETKVLAELSRALQDIAKNVAVTLAAKQTAMIVIPAAAAVLGTIALPVALMGAIRSVIENVWAKAMSRAHSSGLMLAAELAARGFGRRPVSLHGYSLGALIVFVACEELARRDLDGIVHDVHMIGAPVPSSDTSRWNVVRGIVSGRLVNVYNRGDWYLDAISKGTGSTFGRLAGNTPALHAGVENISLSDIHVVISSHAEYALKASEIFLKVGVGNKDARRTWPWAWAPSANEGLKLDLEDLDSPKSSHLSSPASLASPTSPPVVLFTNREHSNRSKHGSQSQLPPPTSL